MAGMLSGRRHPYYLQALLVLALACGTGGASFAAGALADPAAFLAQTEAIRTKDHPLFLQRLDQIHRQSQTLGTPQQWHLRYLDAWEAMFEGDYERSQPQFQDVIQHSGDPALVIKAKALLMASYGISRQYDKAFAMANQLTSELPLVTDPLARRQALTSLSQTFNLAGQTDLALKYARIWLDSIPAGENNCPPLADEVFALSAAKSIKADSTHWKQAIDACTAFDQPVVADALWLEQGEHFLAEGEPSKALARLDQIDTRIQTNHFGPHLLSAQTQRAMAYEKLGQYAKAKAAALSAIKMKGSGDVNVWLRDNYQVLYRLAKRDGDATNALMYYEHYVEQDRGNIDDISARSLAYQLARQQMLATKLQTEELSKQNSILKLQQALDAKAAETSRLYITLLIISLAAIALWLFRTMRSQMRFKGMAMHDGLTGALNHQHFMSESERLLRSLEKKGCHAGLVSIDLDHFKQINDTHGHAAGDEVLKHTVGVCRQYLRSGDLFGRLGGEEFGILLPDCSPEQALDTAERIRLAIVSRPLTFDSRTITASASVGVASTLGTSHGLQQLCRDADAALYRAKQAGRNRVMTDMENQLFVSV